MRRRDFLAWAPALALVAPRPAGAQGAVVTSLTLFAGTPEGLFRTTDWGGTWKRVEGRPSGVRLDALGAVRSIRALGTGVWAAGENGLYYSDDFGETWAPLSVTPGARCVLPSRWPQADPTVFVGTGKELLRSRDGGRTLEPTALSGSGAIHRIEWPGPALVVACDAGVRFSVDEGRSFVAPRSGLPAGPVGAMALSSFFSADPVMFAAPESGGVFRTRDGGTTWASVGLEGTVVGDMIWLGPFLYAAGDQGFFRSSDAGDSWTKLAPSPGRPARLMFPLAPAAGLEAFLATERGIFRTIDAGEHWQPGGLAGQVIHDVATFPAPEAVYERR